MIVLRDYEVSRGSFELRIKELKLQGRRNFMIGRNGSGKSTLLHSIAGLLDSRGAVEVNGMNINDLPPERRKVGLIPQDLLLFGRMSVENNLMVPVRHGSGSVDTFNEVVKELELAPLLGKRASDISMGQAQRVAIARALISEPSVLLMDEPFSFLDEISRIGMLSLIDEYSMRYGFDYVYATHNSRDLENGFTILVSIDAGEIVESVDSLEKIEHFRTLSLLDYRNLVSIDGRYYVLNDESIEFSDSAGSTYEVMGGDSRPYIRFKMDGKFYFATNPKKMEGKFVRIDLRRAREISF